MNSRTDCRYHQQRWAAWHCPGCELHVCRECYPASAPVFGRAGERCPVCNKALQHVSQGGRLVTLWRALPRLLSLAWLDPLVWGLALILAAIGYWRPEFQNIAILVAMAITVTSALMRLPQWSLARWQRWPRITAGPVFRLWLFALYGLLLVLACSQVGVDIATLLLPIGLLLLPIQALLMSGIPFTQATSWRCLVQCIGVGLLLGIVLVVWLVLAGLGVEWAHSNFETLPWFVTPLWWLVAAVAFHWLVVGVAAMAWLLAQTAPEQGLKLAGNQWWHKEMTLARARILSREGQPEKALLSVNQALEHDSDDFQLNLRYLDLLAEVGQIEGFVQHANSVITNLYYGDQQEAALQVCLRALHGHKEFLLDDAELTRQLAEMLIERGHHRLALSLFKGFWRRFTNYHYKEPVLLMMIDSLVAIGEQERAQKLRQQLQHVAPNA